ncbi:unnamed protein product [Peronospora farinosa]|uniref:Reverse transcriptase domain-containing protein n=1 Tax=Peronospora farinosa TaxID=134698 RepID=A0AAV0SYL9_9STRA|nr:unnamed protein product [Peronospora farinosa]
MFNGRPLAPFELGAGVRQGDPLSPALFVLFIEPFLDFLRVKIQDMGLLCGSSTHSVISFADDCTGLLHDLRHTKNLLGFTVVLPFRPWSAATEPLRLELEQLGVVVVGNSGRTKLLGIYYGPQLSNADRLQHLLAEMQARCSLWTHRSRTLRGQLVLTQLRRSPLGWSRAICLFDQAISPWGQDFDILYASVSTIPDYSKSHRWAQLGDYWHSVLFI